MNECVHENETSYSLIARTLLIDFLINYAMNS